MAVVESFKEALKGRVGADRYRMWFTHGVAFSLESDLDGSSTLDGSAGLDGCTSRGDVIATEQLSAKSGKGDRSMLLVSVRGQFALDRLRKNFLSEIRGAAMQACGTRMEVQICLHQPTPHQTDLPLDEASDAEGSALPENQSDNSSASDESSESPTGAAKPTAPQRVKNERQQTHRGRRRTASLSQLIAQGESGGKSAARKQNRRRGTRADAASGSSTPDLQQPELPAFELGDADANQSGNSVPATAAQTAKAEAPAMTTSNLIPGSCNRLAHTAMIMACQDPSTATPLFLCGPTGTGKTHMMSAIADQLRRRHRMRRVIHLSAEQFTNDFINSVGNSGITAFRRRYREVDALLVDDVQFLGSKKATLREMLYTVETLAGSGRPLIFSGLHSPTEIDGLSTELAGRMAAGLVCAVQPLDSSTRAELLQRWISERCASDIPDSLLEAINPMLSGDGRVISGVVNVINTLQRMFNRAPTLQELRHYGGQLLRASKPMTTLSVIETAVCEAFQLPSESLRGKSQTRAVTGPRMLAMFLSRQLTSAAYSEIARHFGGRSHSTAISAEQNVKSWLSQGSEIGRGAAAMPAREALDRVEALLRSG